MRRKSGCAFLPLPLKHSGKRNANPLYVYLFIRLGGALRRLEHCRRRLEQFAAGKLKSIPELDEDILLLSDKDEDGKTILYNDWIYGSIIKPFG